MSDTKKAGRRRIALKDLIVAAVVIAVGVGFAVASSQFAYQARFGRPGPGFLPLWTSVGIIVLGVVLLIEALVSGRKPRSSGTETLGAVPDPAGGEEPPRSWRKPLGAFALFAALVPALAVLGFTLTAIVFIACLLVLLERDRLLPSLIFAVVSAVGLYVVFDIWLQVQLPTGGL